MKRYKTVVVPLSLNPEDKQTIRWAAKIAQLANTEQLIFVHPMDIGDLPEKAKEKYPWLMAPLGKQAIEEMKSLVSKHWSGPEQTEIGYRTVDRTSQSLAVLEVIVETKADFVIVACSPFGHDIGIRLARKAPCSVMVLPKTAPCQLGKILVPIDFSEHCEHALDVATAIAEAEGIKTVESVHVYNIGRSAHRVTMPEEDLIRITRDYVKDKHEAFIKAVDAKGVEVTCRQVCNQVAPQAICYEAQELGCDMIVVGCRGKDTVAALLLGSNAEELMRLSSVPVIAAKAKGSGMSVLEALLGE